MMASFEGHVDVVHVLIEAHADLHQRTKKVGYTGQAYHRLYL